MKKSFPKILSFLLIAVLCVGLFSACEVIEDHKIQVTSWDIQTGTVTGYGTYKTNYDVSLVASPKSENNPFIAWIKDGFVVSRENPYNFKASRETEGKYTAIFNYEGLELMKISKVDLSLYGFPFGENEEKVVDRFSEISIEFGSSSDLLTKTAVITDAQPIEGILSTNEFILSPLVLSSKSEYYCNITLSATYRDTITGEESTKKYRTQLKIDFTKRGDLANNVNIKQDGTQITITKRKLTVDVAWNTKDDGNNPSSIVTMIFSPLQVEEEA